MNKKGIILSILELLIGIVYFILLFIAIFTKNDILINITILPLFLILPIIIGIAPFCIWMDLWKNKKWIFKIFAILLGCIPGVIIVLGLIIFFIGTPFEGVSEVEKFQVVEVKNNKIVIDVSKYYHGDNQKVEIHKPFYVKAKKGDIIQVRHKENSIKNMNYVIDSEIGENMVGLGIVLALILFIVEGLILILKRIWKQKK